MSKVFKSQWGRQYLIPAEYDVFIDWSPLSFKRGTEQEPLEAGKGKFQFLHKWIPESELANY